MMYEIDGYERYTFVPHVRMLRKMAAVVLCLVVLCHY